MRQVVLALMCAGGCGDPVIEMHLVLPSATSTSSMLLDTSCVTGVEVRAVGKNYPADMMDFTESCVEVSGATYQDIAAAVRGKFDLRMPPSGLAGIEMYGWAGPMPCGMYPMYTTPDLVFVSDATYAGADQIDLKLQPNLGCQKATVKVRMIDIVALVQGTNPTSASCPAGAIDDLAGGPPSSGAGTIVARPFENHPEFFGNVEWANQTNGLSTYNALTINGAKGCFALDSSWAGGGSTSCVVGGTPVCAGAGEIEDAIVPSPVVTATASLDTSLVSMYPGIIVGSVWTNSAPKRPAAGATVQIDPTQGAVVYVDPVGTTGLMKRATQSTGPTGMFVLYTNTLPTVTVTAGGQMRTLTIGAPFDRDGAALIVVP